MNELKMAVIGCGYFGSKHSDVITQIPNAKLVCVCDSREEVAAAVAKQCGCDYETDYEKLMERDDIEAVSICVNEDAHLPVALAAAKAKKHILIEKPIATNVKDALTIRAAAEDAGVRLMVGHILKWDGRYTYTEEAIRNGEIGDVISMYFKRSVEHTTAEKFGGKVSFYHYSVVHDFEAMVSFAAPAKAVEVYAAWTDKRNKKYNTEDTVFNTIKFDDGTLACIQACWTLPAHTSLGLVACAEVIGSEGVSYIDLRNQGVEIVREHQEARYPDLTYWPEHYGHTAGKLREEIQHFVTATLKDEPYIVSTDNAIEAVRVIDACFESIRTGMPVKVDRSL